MTWLEMICCAVSAKEGDLCVAGLRTDTGGWVRPVSAVPNGALTAAQCALDHGGGTAKLDVVRVPVVRPRPEPHQPENVLVADHPWQFVRRAERADLAVLLSRVETGPHLLGDTGSGWTAQDLGERPLPASLALVDVRGAEVERWTYGDRPRVSLHFLLARTHYNLGLSDPEYRGRALRLAEGWYDLSQLGVPQTARPLALVSVTGLHADTSRHHKLVAALLPV